jgi:DNA repair exonuclease SbcCD ATPase subunit
MANGYLGKISAIVSANTADFDGKLSKSAKEVSSFARSVQSNLTAASRQAARSLEGIYTPLQKFERSLQAAASMKLSFKGFPGMIKDLDSLQSRLNSALSKRQVDIVLKTTGMSSVSALRDAISGLKSKDIEIITRFGGLDKVRELRDQISSSQPVIDVRVEVDNAKTNIAAIGRQLEAAKAAGGSIAVGVDTAEIDRLTVKLANATAALAGLRKQSSASSGGASGLEKIITDIDELTTRRARLETKALRIRGDERELQSVNRQIDAISKKIESLETRRAKLSVSTEDFTSKIESAQKLVDRLTANKLDKAKAGGATSDVKELEQQLAAAERQAAKLERKLAQTIKVNVGVDADLGELDAVIENANRAGIVLGKLPALMDALGRSDFTAASDKMRQLQSAATGIGEPLAASVQKLRGLGADMAAAFQPALVSAQRATELIASAIDRQGSASGNLQDRTLESYYESVRQKVERTIASIERLGQVSAQIGQLKTGRDFVFEQPRLNEAINRGGDIGNRAAALPAEALRTNPAIAQSLVEIRRLSDEAGVAYAKFLAVKDQKQPTGEAQKELDAVVKKLLEAQAVAEKQIKVVLDTAEADAKATALKAKIVALKQDVAFTVTGKVQNFDQARGEVSRLQADLGKLDASQRAPIARKVVALGKLVEAGDVNSLETVRNLIQQIEKAVGRKLRISLEKEQAQKAAEELAASLAKFRESISFTVTGSVQNVEQARAELGRLQSDVDKLTESQKIAIEPRLQALGELVAGNQITDLEQVRKLIAEIAAKTGSVITLKLQKDEAEKAATELKARLDALREEVRFTVTGGFANAGQIEAEVSRVTADIQKLDAAQKAAFGQRAMLVIDLLGQGKIQDAAIEVKNLRSDLDQQMELKVTTDAAQKAVDDFKEKMERVREQNAFVITDRPQNMEQAESRESSLRGEIGQLDGSRRAQFRGLLEDAAVARETGNLDKYNVALDKITIKLASEKQLVIDDKKAQASLDAINNDLRSVADSLGPPVGMNRLKESTQAADAAVEKLTAGLDKARLKADIGQLRVDIIAAESLPAGAAKDQAIDNISTRAESITQDAGRVAGADDAVEKARTRITSLNDAWAQSIRGLPETEAKVDSFFTGMMADIGKLGLADRISLDPIIAEVMNLIQTGAGISTVTARMLELEAATNELASAGKVSAAIEKLSPTAARNDLEARLAAAKAAATSPNPLATPGETVKDVGRETELRGSLGKDLADSSRGLDLLKGGITSLKSQIDALPEGVRSRFIPAIRDAENEFVRLSTSSSALPGQIDAARQRVQQLAADASRATQAMNFAQSFGGAGAAGLNLGLDQRSLKGYTAQMQIIQGAIGRASADARGPAVAAFERLRTAVSTAFDEGRLDTVATREELARLRQQAVAAAAAVSGIRVGALTRDVARAGDVGRGGFDRFSLALNQAGYAIDDFMSSTGGLEFKLRAVSNNITQLAFILGGTTGLFVGLGAVIAGQAAVAIIKFMNSGRSAEDQTKALNDALAKQKSLVDGLAESHRALADAIMRGTTSSSSESERKIVAGQAGLRRQSAELSAERREAADTSPLAPQSISRMIGEFFEPRQRRNEFQGIAELRAELNKLQKQLEAATTVGERSTIQGRIRETGRAELAARGRLAAEPTPDSTAVAAAIRGSAASSEMASGGTIGDAIAPNDPARNRTGFARFNSQEMFSNIVTGSLSAILGVNSARRDQAASANEGLRSIAAQAPASFQGQIEALRRAQELKRPEQAQADLGFIRTSAALDADREIAKFEAMIQSLQKAMESGIVDSASETYAASVDAANSIRVAQEDVADAIKRGVPSALAFQSELDKLSSELAAADEELRSAVTANPDDPNVTPERREAAIKRAQDRVESVNRQRADVESRAREVRLGRTFGGERTTRAISSLEGNERFANEQAGLVARLKRVVDDEVQARRKASEAAAREAAIVDLIAKKRTEVENSGSDINKRKIAEADIKAAEADLEKATAARESASATSNLAQKASEAAAALAEAAAGIEAAFTRIRKVGDSALQRSEQGADAAQRAFEENPLRAGGREARDAAEQRLINDRALLGNAQANLDNRRREIQQNPQMAAINGELEAITQRRQDLEAKSGLNQAENAELDAATKREIELLRQREMMARQLTEAERKQLDAINNGIAAREKELELGRRRTEESPEFSRISSQEEGALGEANRRADEAQQRFANNPTDENKQRRDEAEGNLRRRQSRLQRFQDLADSARNQIEASPEFQQNNKELQQIAERRAQIAENSAGRAMTPAEIGELTGQGGLLDREMALRGKNEGLMQQGLEPFRNGIDDTQKADALRNRADRGRNLGMTDQERFRKEFAEGAGADINARAAEMRAAGEKPNKFLQQAFKNQMEAVAPMLQGFQEERQNAMLQGPSRAALNVSDVSTSQGASELTRLIRGDDSAKDVNLAELRKQSAKLQEVVDQLKANNPGVLL